MVTSIEPAKPSYPAEDYHQDFYRKQPARFALEELGGREQFKHTHWQG
ncbi:peptide-methionine (S)-S-oxide reductase [Staphylococcus epidermidis]